MPSTTAKQIIDRAAILLQDTTNIRWPRTELLEWLVEAQQYIVAVKPGARAKVTSRQLSAGSRQTLPDDGASLIDITRNTTGSAIRLVSREILDAQIPNWHTQTSTTVVTHYVYDPNAPEIFHVYPPNNGSGSVELIYAATPGAVANEAAAITLNDFYAPAILNYVMYRAYSKDSDYAANDANAKAYFAAFESALSGKQAFEGVTNPNQALAPMNPNTLVGSVK